MDNQRILTRSQVEAILFNRRDRLGGLVQHDSSQRLKLDLWSGRHVYAVLGLEPLHEMTFIGGGVYYPPTNVLSISLPPARQTHQQIEIELAAQEIRPLQQLGPSLIAASTPWSVTQRQNGNMEFRRSVVAVAMMRSE